MINIKSMSAVMVAANPLLSIVDIRPIDERYAEIGYIPGSLSVPLDVDSPSLPGHAAAFESASIVLVCLSGRRSMDLCKVFAQRYGVPTTNLDGGMLAWAGSGLPVCGIDPMNPKMVPKINKLGELPRVMASCFVGEMIEVSLDRDLNPEADFLAMLRRCFEIEKVDWDNPSFAGIFKVLNRAAFVSRRFGNDLERVRRNLDMFVTSVENYKAEHGKPEDP